MKKLLTVIAFASAMLIGANSASAQSLKQDQDRPEVVAKKKVSDLSEQLDLTGDQQRSLFRAYVSKEVNYRKYVNGKDLSDPAVAANKKKYDDVFVAAVKKQLTAEQYKKWLTLQNQ